MKKFAEICLELGLNLSDTPPELKKQWVAYVGGKVVPCMSMNEAISKSSLYEHLISEESSRAHDQYFVDRTTLEKKASTVFRKYLRKEFSYLSDEIYDILLEEAFRDNIGLDAVAFRLSRNVDLYNRLQKEHA